MHGRKEFASARLQVAVMLYFVSCNLAAVYFNWQYAAPQEGFIRWLCFGEVVATAKGFAWPYFASPSSCFDQQALAQAYDRRDAADLRQGDLDRGHQAG